MMIGYFVRTDDEEHWGFTLAGTTGRQTGEDTARVEKTLLEQGVWK